MRSPEARGGGGVGVGSGYGVCEVGSKRSAELITGSAPALAAKARPFAFRLSRPRCLHILHYSEFEFGIASPPPAPAPPRPPPSPEQVRGHGGQGANHWPPFAVRPLSPGARGQGGWAWSVVRGVQLCPWAAGFGGRRPRPAPGLAPLPLLLRTGGCRPGAEAARVLGSQTWAAAPAICPGTGCNSPSFGRASSDRPSPPSSSHFHSRTRSCADSDWRSGVNQGRESLFRHIDCTTR
jgi:hypothetical protein